MRLIALATAALAGCFAPSLPEGFSCAGDGLCPVGQFCDPVDDRCRFVALDDASSDTDGAGGPDAAADLCSPAGVALCLTMDGDTLDHSPQSVATSATGISFAPGQLGQAAVFAAGSEILATDYLATTPDETIELWLFPEADGRLLETPLLSADFETDAVTFTIDAGGMLSIGVPTNQWVHLAITLGDQTRLFVNGSSNVSIGFNHAPTANPDLSAGSQGGSFAGRIDNLRVWNRALGDAEIAAIAAAN